MYNFGSATPGSTSFLAQSTPINQTRSASGFLFNSTATQPSTLTSTPFGSTTLFGTSINDFFWRRRIIFVRFQGGATPAATSTTTSTGTGTIHKFDAVLGTDKINKNGIQTQIRTKIFNVCAMPVYEKKSMEVRFDQSFLSFTDTKCILNRNFDSKIMSTIENLLQQQQQQQQVCFHRQQQARLYLVAQQHSQIVCQTNDILW